MQNLMVLKEMPKTNPSGGLDGHSGNRHFTLSANGVVVE